MIFVLIFLSAVGVTLIGGTAMIATLSIHFLVYIVIEFVRRAEGRTVFA